MRNSEMLEAIYEEVCYSDSIDSLELEQSIRLIIERIDLLTEDIQKMLEDKNDNSK